MKRNTPRHRFGGGGFCCKGEGRGREEGSVRRSRWGRYRIGPLPAVEGMVPPKACPAALKKIRVLPLTTAGPVILSFFPFSFPTATVLPAVVPVGAFALLLPGGGFLLLLPGSAALLAGARFSSAEGLNRALSPSRLSGRAGGGVTFRSFSSSSRGGAT